MPRVLMLLIVSVALHGVLVGLGLLFFGAEGSRTPAFSDLRLDLGGVPVTGQSLVVVGVTLVLVIAHVPFLRPHHGRQGAARDGDEPRRRPPDGHSDRALGRPQLCAGRPDRRGVGPADRPADHGVLRHRFPDRPQGFRRRHHRRHGQLSAGAGRRPAGGPARILFLLLGQRVQGGAGVHPDHPGAVVALDAQPPRGRDEE